MVFFFFICNRKALVILSHPYLPYNTERELRVAYLLGPPLIHLKVTHTHSSFPQDPLWLNKSAKQNPLLLEDRAGREKQRFLPVFSLPAKHHSVGSMLNPSTNSLGLL